MNATRTALAIKKREVVLARPSAVPLVTKEIREMLMYEELSRTRIRELRALAQARIGGRDGVTARLSRAVRRMRGVRPGG